MYTYQLEEGKWVENSLATGWDIITSLAGTMLELPWRWDGERRTCIVVAGGNLEKNWVIGLDRAPVLGL